MEDQVATVVEDQPPPPVEPPTEPIELPAPEPVPAEEPATDPASVVEGPNPDAPVPGDPEQLPLPEPEAPPSEPPAPEPPAELPAPPPAEPASPEPVEPLELPEPRPEDAAPVFNPAPYNVTSQHSGTIYTLLGGPHGFVSLVPRKAAEHFCGRNNAGGKLTSLGIRLLLDPDEALANGVFRFGDAAEKAGVSIREFCLDENEKIAAAGRTAFKVYERARLEAEANKAK